MLDSENGDLPHKHLSQSRHLVRISHRLSTAASDTGMFTALRSVGLLDILSSMPAGPSVARLVPKPVFAASLRNPMRNAD